MDSIYTKIDGFKANTFIPSKVNIDSSIINKCNTSIQHKPVSDYHFTDIDTTITVPVLIFVLGFIITESIRRWNKSNELKQYKQFIEEWVNKSNSPLDNYIKSLQKFSNEIKENTDFNIPKWETGIIHLSRINSIPLEKYSDIYLFGISNKIENENRRQLMNFLYQLEYIEKCPSIIMSIYNEYCKQNEKIMDEWNLYYMQLIDLFQMYNNLRSDTFERICFHRIMKLFIPLLAEASKGEIITINRWSDDFISPSMKILSNEACVDSPLLLQIIKLIKGLNITIIKHNKLNQFNVVFDEYIKSLKSAQSMINESILYFKNKKIKRWCR